MKNVILTLAALIASACSGSLSKYKGDVAAENVEVPDDVAVDLPIEPLPDITIDITPDLPVDAPPEPLTDPSPTPACSGGARDTQDFPGGTMVGCAGWAYWPGRQGLCATGWRVCTAAEWVMRRGGVAPGYNYWTADQLQYAGTPENCWVVLEGGNPCYRESTPMRVCAGNYDPIGNGCNWFDCAYGAPGPNEYFGGCNNNNTAGTLCCR